MIDPVLADDRVKININTIITGQPGIESSSAFLPVVRSRILLQRPLHHLRNAAPFPVGKQPRKIAGFGGAYRELRLCHGILLAEMAIDGKMAVFRCC